jgi:hypothetical protein
VAKTEGQTFTERHEPCDWRQSSTVLRGLGVKSPGPTRPSTGSCASYMAEIPTSSEDKLRNHAARPNCLLCDLICLRRGQFALQTLDL